MIGGLLARLDAGRFSRAALRVTVLVAAILLLLLARRRSGERLGRLAERLETVARTNDVQRKPARHVVSKTMLPIAPRPRHHAELHFRSSRVLDLI